MGEWAAAAAVAAAHVVICTWMASAVCESPAESARHNSVSLSKTPCEHHPTEQAVG